MPRFAMADLSYPLLMFLLGLSFAVGSLQPRHPLGWVASLATSAWALVLWTESFRLRLPVPDILVLALAWTGLALMLFALVRQLRVTLRAPDANGIVPPL